VAESSFQQATVTIQMDLRDYLRDFEEEQAEHAAEIARQMRVRDGQESEAENGA
jgi:hypothetical protein